MFGAVVHEHAADILHRADGDDIQYKDDEAQPALRKVVPYVAETQIFRKNEVGEQHGQGDEQPHRERHAQNGGDDGDRAHHVDMQFIAAPDLEFRGFVGVAVHFRAAHQDLRTRHERGYEVDDAAHQRDLGGAAHMFGDREALFLHLDIALGIAHGSRVGSFAAHHHAL